MFGTIEFGPATSGQTMIVSLADDATNVVLWSGTSSQASGVVFGFTITTAALANVSANGENGASQIAAGIDISVAGYAGSSGIIKTFGLFGNPAWGAHTLGWDYVEGSGQHINPVYVSSSGQLSANFWHPDWRQCHD